jgi:hypothetical protein
MTRRERMLRGAAPALVAWLAACHFGGPTGNPYTYVEGDASDDAGSAAQASTGAFDGTTPISVADAGAAQGDDAFVGPDPGFGDDGSSGGAEGGGACQETVAVCDPVHNTGCNPLQQCDVDPTQTMTATGLCLFYSASDAASCTATAFTESCPARSTCVTGSCKALCFCDSDCPAGQCCSDTSGPTGFTLCATCP